MDRGAWWATVQGVAESQTRLSNCHFHHHRLGYGLSRGSITMKTSGLETNAPKDEASGISETHDIALSYPSEAELFTVL